MKLFDAPESALGDLGTEAAAELIAAASDIALILDNEGRVLDLAFGNDELSAQIGDWIGMDWADTVTSDSRDKVELLLSSARADEQPPHWDQVEHVALSGDELPVRYCAASLGNRHRIVAVGRSQQGMAALQQRLVDAQQSLERDYWRLRQLETRYRLLFRSMSEAILIVDPGNGKIVEANPAASLLLAADSRKLVGRAFPEGFDATGTEAIKSLLAGVRSAGRSADVRARLTERDIEFLISAAPVRQENATLLLVRLSPVETESNTSMAGEPRSRLFKMLENAPDGVVITRQDGRILSANNAFLELAQLSTEEQVRGESLDRWLGRPGVDLNVLIANLRQHGAVRLFATSIRSDYGSSSEVEISAVAVQNADQPSFGFIIRNVDRRVSAGGSPGRALPRSVEQLTELVGRVPLKEVVRESTDMIERLCIEAALELTGDNRASAAELLGLSRQSLYVKLRRYGLSESGSESGAEHATEH
ncbi:MULTISPECIES: transcriptional regulator PpsR [Thiorhodovibrio]|uniref:transcriptional regulator PpsR n=1 Tax=Thiorhodovibrio TaxID=61593 RepID=UPI002B2620D3|nr:transcriptional regulator PpsR [Thiorhodovibrio litoralis]WPL14251.1 transcriptional regulator PpsR [Thiorhodovibrio litoralis]